MDPFLKTVNSTGYLSDSPRQELVKEIELLRALSYFAFSIIGVWPNKKALIKTKNVCLCQASQRKWVYIHR